MNQHARRYTLGAAAVGIVAAAALAAPLTDASADWTPVTRGLAESPARLLPPTVSTAHPVSVVRTVLDDSGRPVVTANRATDRATAEGLIRAGQRAPRAIAVELDAPVYTMGVPAGTDPYSGSAVGSGDHPGHRRLAEVHRRRGDRRGHRQRRRRRPPGPRRSGPPGRRPGRQHLRHQHRPERARHPRGRHDRGPDRQRHRRRPARAGHQDPADPHARTPTAAACMSDGRDRHRLRRRPRRPGGQHVAGLDRPGRRGDQRDRVRPKQGRRGRRLGRQQPVQWQPDELPGRRPRRDRGRLDRLGRPGQQLLQPGRLRRHRGARLEHPEHHPGREGQLRLHERHVDGRARTSPRSPRC